MAVTKSEQVVREASDIEAYKIGLLASAKQLADTRCSTSAANGCGDVRPSA